MFHGSSVSENDSQKRLLQCISSFQGGGNDQEVEIRLGFLQADGRFQAGVPLYVFDRLETEMKQAGLASNNKWEEVVDYFYCLPGNGRKQVRTRVTTNTEEMTLEKEHIIKTCTQSVILTRGLDQGEVCRVVLSREEKVFCPPQACLPNHVRIKQRKRFQDIRNEKVAWCYELSKTWSSSSRQGAEHLQHTCEPVYEVECELVDEGFCYTEKKSAPYIVKSLLMKSNVLLGEEPDFSLSIHDPNESSKETDGKRRKKTIKEV